VCFVSQKRCHQCAFMHNKRMPSEDCSHFFWPSVNPERLKLFNFAFIFFIMVESTNQKSHLEDNP
jgi:hypothetical protein